jgi:hypothetical protein
MAQEGKDRTPLYGYLARVFRPFPDFDPFFIKPVRQKAVELLNHTSDRFEVLGASELKPG